MPSPTAGDVHVNRPLGNISIAFLQSQDSFIATKVFPNVPVAKQSDRYITYDRGEFNRDEAELRAPGTESAGGKYTVDNTPTYFCDIWAFHKDIPDQIRANADEQLDLDREATEYVSLKMMIRREKRFASKYLSTGVWTTDVTGVAGAPGASEVRQWSDYTNSDPITDMRAGITTIQKSTGFRPNTMVFGQEVWDKLVDHPDIIDRVKYGQTAGKPAMGTKEALAQILEIERIFVGSAIENTAHEGQTNAHSFITGKKALICYSAPAPGLMTPSAGYHFSWTGYLAAGKEGTRIKRFRLEREASDRVEGEIAFDAKLIAGDLGYFFNSVIA